MSAALAFNESHIHRDAGGRFSPFEQRWTAAKGGRAWNVGRSAVPNTRSAPVGGFALGSKMPGIPRDYTGSPDLSATAGSFEQLNVTHQVPKTGLKAHGEHFKALVDAAEALRSPVIDKAVKAGKIPDKTPKSSLRRAYNHAALLAMHDFHVIDYSFKMDDHLKDELTPLKPFMTYARRRITDAYRSAFKGKQMPYRAEFGHKFPTPKFDKTTGQERLRPRPNHELIKAFGAAIAAPNANPNVLPVQQGVSRWDRYRLAIAHNENQGQGDFKQLTLAQKMERVHAARLGAQKIKSGAQRILPGQPGSIARDGVAQRDYGTYVARAMHPPRMPGLGKLAKRTHEHYAHENLDSRLVQPAQTAGAAVGSTLAAHAAHTATRGIVQRKAASVGHTNAARFRQFSTNSKVSWRGASGDVLRSQAKMINHGSRIGAGLALTGAIGLAAATAGDYVGDLVGRKISGAKGKNDTYRHLSPLGMLAGIAGGHATGMLLRNSRNRVLRHAVGARVAAAAGGSVAATAAGEAVGNVQDEKLSVGRSIIGADRRLGKSAAHPAAIAATPAHLRQLIVDPHGTGEREAHLASIMPDEVRAMMPELHAVIARGIGRMPSADRRTLNRHHINDAIADHRTPLHRIIQR